MVLISKECFGLQAIKLLFFSFYHMTRNPKVVLVIQPGKGAMSGSQTSCPLHLGQKIITAIYPFMDPIQEEVGVVAKKKMTFSSCSFLGKYFLEIL